MSYADLTRSEIEDRLRIAEDVCVMYGWGGIMTETPRQRACLVLWRRWAERVGMAFISPDNHPDLDALERSV